MNGKSNSILDGYETAEIIEDFEREGDLYHAVLDFLENAAEHEGAEVGEECDFIVAVLDLTRHSNVNENFREKVYEEAIRLYKAFATQFKFIKKTYTKEHTYMEIEYL